MNKKVTVGFDGYVDNILRVRRSADSFFSTMTEFGQYIQSRSHRSGSLELHKTVEKIGGNMPIFALALARLQVDVSCVGALGYPEISPVFHPLTELCSIKSVSDPGYCDALEFDDGKLMLALNEDIESLNYPLLLERAGREYLMEVFRGSDMIVMLNWSELKGSLSIWNGLNRDFFGKLSDRKRDLFIDLSDCSGRTAEDIAEAVRLIREFSEYFHVSLSLNRNEAERIAQVCGISWETLEEAVMGLYDHLGCTRVILHLVDRCCCAFEKELLMQRTRFIRHPVLSTGGGDNFNAGFAYGILRGLSCDDCIRLANSVSSFYVANGYSPTPDEVCNWYECGEVLTESTENTLK